MPLYLSRYVGSGRKGDPCRPLGSEQPGWSAIDLRPDGGRTRDGNGLNACLLWLPEPVVGLEMLGWDKSERVSMAARKVLSSKLSSVQRSTLQETIMELLLYPPRHGWNPIRPDAAGQHRVWFGDEWASQVVVDGVMSRRLASDAFKRLSWWKIAAAALLLLGSSVLFGKVLASDDFNRANGGLPGANWTLITGSDTPNISSNQVIDSNTGNGNDANAFYSSITWPNDQYSKAVATTLVSQSVPGVVTRADTGAARTYLFGFFDTPGASANHTIYKNVSNVLTLIETGGGVTFNNGDTLELRSQGTIHTIMRNGAKIANANDAAIASGAAGLSVVALTTGGTGVIDSWEGGDLVAAGPFKGGISH